MAETTKLARSFEAAERAYEVYGSALLKMKDDDPRAQEFIRTATAWVEELYWSQAVATAEQAINHAAYTEGSKVRALAVMMFG